MKVGDEVVVVGPSITGRTLWLGKKGIITYICGKEIHISEHMPRIGYYHRDSVQKFLTNITKQELIKRFNQFVIL